MAIVAAIRVGGPLWLRTIIGKAEDTRAVVEMELMSSTSHEVYELWSGHGIIRTMGKPEVRQIICLEIPNAKITSRQHTVESASEAGLLKPERTYARHIDCPVD